MTRTTVKAQTLITAPRRRMSRRFAMAAAGLLGAFALTLSPRALADKPDAAGNDHAVVPRAEAEAFLKHICAGEIEEAFDGIYDSAAPMLAEKEEVRANLVEITHKIEGAYGKPTSTTLYRMRTAGDDLIELFYLAKASGSPTGWRFTYYRSGAGFELIHIEVTHDSDTLLDENAEPGDAPAAAAAVSDAFMKNLIKGNTREAYDALFAKGTEQLVAKCDEFAAQMTGNTEKAIALYGALSSSSLAKVVKLTDDVVQIKYFVKTPKLPLVWTLSLYKPAEKYLVMGVSFNEHYQDVLTAKK